VAVAAPRPAATAPDPAPLILRYRQALDTLDAFPFVFVVRRRRGRLSFLLWTIRLRPLTRYFVVAHVASRAGSLRRLYYAKSVCTGDREYERAAQLVEAFEKSLSTVRRKLHLVAALFATFSVAYLLARFATPKVDPLSGFFHNQDDVTARFAAEPLREAAAAVLSLKPADAWQALQSLADAHASHSLLHVVLGNVITTVILLGIAAWLVAALPLAAFRLKRMLFNLECAGDVRGSVSRDHVASATGLYRAESELFARLGRRAPREFPLDLACQAAVLILPFWLALLAANATARLLLQAIEHRQYTGEMSAYSVVFFYPVFLAMLPLARMAVLYSAHRRRLADATSVTVRRPECDRLATRRRRAAATVIDLVVVGAVWSLVHLALRGRSETFALVEVYLVPPLLLLLYEALCASRGYGLGRTLGRRFLGLQVVGVDDVLHWRHLVARDIALKGFVFGPLWILAAPILAPQIGSTWWMFALLTWPIFAVDFVASLFNNRRATLHDLLTNTVVAHVAPVPLTVPRLGVLRLPLGARAPAGS